MDLVRQTLLNDSYKDKIASLVISALFDNKGVAQLKNQKREKSTREEGTQTEKVIEENIKITQHCPERDSFMQVEPNNENENFIQQYEEKNNEGNISRTKIKFCNQLYRFDPYCSRRPLQLEDDSGEMSRSRLSSSSKSRSSSMASRSRTIRLPCVKNLI